MTEPEHAYELKLVCEGNDACEVRWHAIIKGKEVIFDSDGDAGFTDKMLVFFSRMLPVEELFLYVKSIIIIIIRFHLVMSILGSLRKKIRKLRV